jgi:hypothetical protein
MVFVRVFPNDSKRCIYVETEDLHPSSVLKMTITKDQRKRIRVNVSRNVLASLVASYRHNILLLKGKVSVDELILEMNRDCVTIEPIGADSLNCKDVRHLCETVVSDIVTWDRMLNGMSSLRRGCTPEWTTTSSRVIIQFASKPRIYESSKGLKSLILGVVSYLLNHVIEFTLDESFDVLLNKCDSCLELKNISKYMFLMNEVETIKRKSQFWPLEHEFTIHIWRSLDRLTNKSEFLQYCVKIYKEMPNLKRIFGFVSTTLSMEQQYMSYVFEKNGFKVLSWEKQTSNNALPLVYPNDWVDSVRMCKYRSEEAPTIILEKQHGI